MNRSRDESGQTVVVIAAFMGLLMLGFLALALDVGFLFHQKRVAQAAADAAALAAAEESGNPNQQSVANAMATMNGFDTTLATNPAVVTLTTPSSGNFVGPSYVQATVTMPVHTFFLGSFNSSMITVPVSATAIAGGGGASSQTCVCVTHGPIVINNGAHMSAVNCGVFDNSTSATAIQVAGGSTLTAATVASASLNWIDTITPTQQQWQPPLLQLFPAPTVLLEGISTLCTAPTQLIPPYSTCSPDPGVGGYGGNGGVTRTPFGPATATSAAVCYNGLSVGNNGDTDTLNPGVYVITGPLHFAYGANSKSNLGGNGVFIYLTATASLTIDNGANVNLVAGNAALSGGGTAPDLGTAYDGTVIYQAPGNSSAISFQGGSTTFVNGAINAPSAPLTIGNGSGGTVSGGVASSSLTLNGGGTFNATATMGEGSVITGSAHPKLVQ